MSETNGNVLKYQVEELLQWKSGAQPIIDLVKNYKHDIKDLNVMREQIANINDKINKQESHKRQLLYIGLTIAASSIASLLINILKSL